MERADRVAALTEKKRALLARRLRGRAKADASPETIPRRAGEAAARLSFAQERLWFLERWQPGSAVYNLLDAVRLTGSLDAANLAGAFAAVLRRHESLRSVVVEVDGVPFQETRPFAFEFFPVVDLTSLPPARRSSWARDVAATEGRHSFDLASGPLFRTVLLRLGPEEHLLVLVTHHIMTDLWSFGVLIRELGAFYKAGHGGPRGAVPPPEPPPPEPPLPEPPIQYADFAAWQRQWLSGDVLRRELEYWTKQLDGAPASLELPTDRPRPSVQSFHGASASFSLPASLCEALQALAQSSGATLFMVFTAALSALLCRYTGQQDVVLGSPIAGRNRRELEPLIGFFVNTLVLRADLSGAPSFHELLNRLRETTLEAFAHQDLPFDRLVEELRPVRDPSRPPLVQVLLAFQRSPVEDFELPGLSFSPLDMESGTAKFDLTFFMTEEGGEVSGAIEYNTDLFDATRIRRLAGHFRQLLQGAVDETLKPFPGLNLLSPAERQQWLEWNDTEATFPREGTLAQLLGDQAEQRPEAVALVERPAAEGAETRAVSFRELLRRADRLARALRTRGVGPEVLVGLLAERSSESLVATAGILRAGGAYLPLDPRLPEPRLRFVLADGAVAVVLAESRWSALVRDSAAEVITLESALAPSEDPEPFDGAAADPAQLAYVNYTSGSTGKPKGVGVTHRSVLRLLFGVSYARFGPRESFLHLAPASFDASTLEIWAPLLHGGRCVLFPPVIPTATELERSLLDHRVTSLWLTSSLFNRVVDENPAALSAVQQLLVGGEELSVPHVRRAARALPETRLINGYGPTESTTFTCCYPLPGVPLPGVPDAAAAISIGRPIGNTRGYLVDPLGRRVPVSHPGELLIGGDGLARGYLNRPRLTGERFVPDPFGGAPGGRLYRSGDRARWLADGRLDFQGRFDHQVKIRGFRIELGEIEASLAAHPGIRAVAVLAREDKPGERRLAAYLVPAAAAVPTLEQMRADLRERLPDYMVPAAWVILDRMPLTSSGKIDRGALPAPDPALAAGDGRAPRTWTEELLAEIWADVLGLDRVGAESNFFELGGHSLLAVQVASRVSQVFGLELPIRAFFEAATLRDLAEQLRAATDATASRPPLVPVPRDRDLALSYAQERLWFLDQLELASTAYNVSLALRAVGAFEPELLARCLSEVVRRHEVLRTGFRTVKDVPVQVIHAPAPLAVPVVDLRALPEPRRRQQARRLAAEDASRPFDLIAGPMLRVVLLRLARDESVVVLTLHHVASDGWSIGVLVRELAALYPALAAGKPSPLPELSVQYADFAAWQRQWLAGDVLEAQSRHWKERLGDARHVLDLPTDRPRPPMETFHGALRRFSVPRHLCERLRTLARSQGATLFMVCLAAWQVLLHRYTGHRQILVGSPVAGRNHRELEELIGFFVNTLVLRGDLRPDDVFTELLSRLRETTLDAFAHQDLPFERLVEDLQPERDLSRPPLVQVLFVLLNTPLEPLELPDLRLTPFDFDPGTAKFDLSLSLMEVDGALAGTFEYNTDLFDATRIARAGGHYLQLLERICATPQGRLGDFRLLSRAERQQVRVEWNATRTRYPRGTCLHQLFEEQARRSPGAVAVRYEGESLTYRELDRRANRLANYLLSQGVGPEVVVGVLLERSFEMVVALFGVLKAGGAYLPLDPSYPRERLSFFVQDVAPALVLSARALSHLVPSGQRTFLLDANQEVLASSGDERPAAEAGVGQLAYVIYTSGSTGRPKGVMNAHRGIVNRIRWMQEAYGLGAGDRVLQKTPFSFDVSVWEFFWPLAVGARLVMARPDGHRDPEYLNDVIAAEKVTTLHFVPSMLRAFLGVESRGRCRSLRRVIASGEELSTELGERFHARLGGVELHNLYGPTEAAVDVTAIPCRPGDVRREVNPGLSIGRPIANLRIHLLERNGRPVPPGVPGELHIGGIGVGRGYLARPGLSAQRFVPDPFAARAGCRLYRTGDLARYRADGAIEFLGRLDHQVKLRGFRIELGEIEAAAAQLPTVRRAVVIAHGQGQERCLVAYVVPRGERPPESVQLREHLRERLPDYMVPAIFVILEELPLTPSGKVDRGRLPAPDPSRSTAAAVTPRTPSEELLAGIWAEILGRQDFGVEDDFFALGGHSLLAVQVISRVRRVFGVELSLRKVFETPTLTALARHLDSAESASTSLPLVSQARDQPLPLSFAQERLWFLDQLAPGSATYNMPVVLRLAGVLHHAALQAGLRHFVCRHEALRTTFAAENDRPVQVLRPPEGVPSLLVADLRDLPAGAREAEAARLFDREAHRPFDLERGPLFRALLVRVEAEEHRALFVLHHIASDGWSMGILVREIVELYRAALEDTAPDLAELPVQYADFAHWQRRWLRGEVLERQIDYWRTRLEGVPVLELPADRPPAKLPVQRGRHLDFHLDAALADQLRGLGRSAGATLFMVLFAGFTALLRRLTGQRDFAVGSPVAGRGRLETEGLVGFFVNTLVLRADVESNPTFGELLRRLRDSALEAYRHQDVPFEKLVEEIGPERQLGVSPFFQVMLALQNAPPPLPELPELTLEELDVAGTTAKFDLTLGFAELPETGTGLVGDVEYDVDLFDTTRIRRLTGQLRRLLETVTEDPARRLSDVDLLEDAERQQLLNEWNDTAVAFDLERTVLDDVRAALASWPDAVAVAADGGPVLSYGELGRRAGVLAQRLEALGAGPHGRVGLLLERSPELVVAALAAFEVGAAYVPIDPALPVERIRYMVADACVPVLLTTGQNAAAAQDLDVVTVRLDLPANGPAISPDPAAGPHADDLAYVIYTSGSTGRPKGTELAHRGLANLVAWHRAYFGLTREDRVTQVAAPGFDVAVEEIWPTLAAGAALLIPRREVVVDVEHLGDWLGAHRVTLTDLPAPVVAELLDRPLNVSSLRKMSTGGDRLPSHPSRELPFELLNCYGPTEASVSTITARIRSASRQAVPPIGRPNANVRLTLTDRRLRPVPLGVRGELCLAGVSLARGYLRRPAATGAVFVPDPFTHGAVGARLYRTGDLARWRADGLLDFLGRIDHQVKVRGFRIELGEVEAVLLDHPEVRQGVVVLHQDERGERHLAAYAVGASELTAEALREFLGTRLPAFMVPPFLVLMDALPLTANNKIDLRALPAPHPRTPSGKDVALRTPTQELLAGIWSEVLGLESVVSRNADFFELGGHSLLATRVASRIRRDFGIDLALRQLFENPTLEALAAHVDGRDRVAVAPPMVRVPRDQPLPLSFAQERLWFLDRLEPGSSAYNIPGAFRVRGELDRRLLARALSEIVSRHEVLRTVFQARAGIPVQVIRAPAPVPVPVADLGFLPLARREAEARKLVGDEAARPFDLAEGPVIRVSLVALARDHYLVVFNMHHISSDGWSMSVWAREFAALYRAFAEERPSPLAPLPLQYADFAVWQREYLAGEWFEAELGYWRRQLDATDSTLRLPLDRPRSAQLRRGLDHRALVIGPAATEALRACCRTRRVTFFMAVLAAYQALLHRVSGQSDLCVGTPVAGRDRLEVEELIGFFVNTLVIRSRTGADPTFSEHLARVRETTLAAYQHQALPFEKLVEHLRPERDRTHSPFFQAVFILMDALEAGLQTPGLAFEPLGMMPGAAKYDLVLRLEDTASEVSGQLEYNTDLMDASTVGRLKEQFLILLRSALENPDRKLSQLRLLSAGTRHQVLFEWGRGESGSPRGVYPRPPQSLHGLVETRADQKPEATALVAQDAHLSYRELDARAASLARELCRRGVEPDSRVGLLAERSIEMIVGLLGTLKAGGAYVPLDPSYPAAHLAVVLEESRPAAVLVAQADPGVLPLGSEKLLSLAAGALPQVEEADSPPVGRIDPEHLAYVIYTSGSTGRPKGVMCPHRAITNHLLARQELHPSEAGGRFLQQAPFSFEMSVWEIFWPLTSGATLVLAKPGGEKDTAYLVAAVAEREITALRFTPSMLALFLERPSLDGWRALRHIYTGAESMPLEMMERHDRMLPGRLHHLYGPTETCVAASLFVGRLRSSYRKVPIGRSLAGAGLYVLDGRGEGAPPGSGGELHVGGPGVTRGYLRQGARTAERFVPHPWGEPGSRLYRTGDRVRWLADGQLDFLGRVDHQVKIRGFRVELGHVESILASHPGVREAAVLAPESEGDRRLLAYMEAIGSELDGGELREHLRRQLPEYMVPARLFVLQTFPRTTNGKVDRRALAAMEDVEPSGAPERAPTPPRDDLELALLRTWEDVLGLPRIGIDESFFDLGGHSLLAVRLMARIEERLGHTLPLASLFEGATIEGQAALLRAVGASGAEGRKGRARALVTIDGRGEATPLFFVHPIGGNVFCYRELARQLGGERPFYGLQTVPPRPGDDATVEAMAERYLEEVREVQDEGPYLLGGWSMGALVTYEMALRLRHQGQEVALLALLDPPPPQIEPAAAPRDEAALLESFARDLTGLGYGETVSRLSKLGAESLLKTLDDEATDAAKGDTDLAVWHRLFRLYRFNAAAMRAYLPRPYDGRVDLFLADDGEDLDASIGWRAFASGAFEIHRLPGGHYDLLRQPLVTHLAEILDAHFDLLARPEPALEYQA